MTYEEQSFRNLSLRAHKNGVFWSKYGPAPPDFFADYKPPTGFIEFLSFFFVCVCVFIFLFFGVLCLGLLLSLFLFIYGPRV